MSITSIDTFSWTISPLNLLALSVVALFVIILGSLKLLFGTISLWEILADYKRRKHLSEKYLQLFKTRDNMEYHISWAKARGDNGDADRMLNDLGNLDKVPKPFNTLLPKANSFLKKNMPLGNR